MSLVRPARLGLLTVTILACGGSDRAPGPADTTAAGSAAAPAGSDLTLPEGFTATVFADGIGLARHVATAPGGAVYINTWQSPYDTTRRPPAGGFLVMLRDGDGDGRAEVVRRFGQTSEAGGQGGTGIAYYRNAVYAEAGPNILRYRLASGDPVPSSPPDTIVTGLPLGGGHPMHPFAIDSQGNLFVNSGSNTNACQVKDRTPGSPGEKPCRELATNAGIWRFDASRTGQKFSPSARYATGIRNAVAMAVHPDGQLYVAQHGRDQLAENWPKLYDWKQSAHLPAEELIRVERGGDYGWPYCYYDPDQKKLVLAPEYGGDGRKVGECADKDPPVAVFPAHWAPNGLVFYTGEAFPERFRGGAFIAFHGSWNRAPEPQEGYNVVFQPMEGGKATGDFQIFADGFAGARKEPGLADHRPAGVAVGPDGALYITDDQAGRIWRVTHGR